MNNNQIIIGYILTYNTAAIIANIERIYLNNKLMKSLKLAKRLADTDEKKRNLHIISGLIYSRPSGVGNSGGGICSYFYKCIGWLG